MSRTLIAWLISGVLLSGTAWAGGDDDVVTRRGQCSGPSSWLFRAVELDNGGDDRVRLRFRVDGDVARQRWRMRLFRNNNRVLNVIRRAAPNGNVNARRVVREDDDALFRAFARNLRTGETCRARIRWDD